MTAAGLRRELEHVTTYLERAVAREAQFRVKLREETEHVASLRARKARIEADLAREEAAS